MEDNESVLQGTLIKKGNINPSGCQGCGKAIPSDERINCDGRIVCGECFLHSRDIRPVEPISGAYIDAPGEQEIDQAELIMQLIEMVHSHEERILELEKEMIKLDSQMDSICG